MKTKTPKRNTEGTITVQLEPDIHRWLREYVRSHDRSQRGLVDEALRDLRIKFIGSK